MEYYFKILKQINQEEWNNNLLNNSYSTFFQSAEYLIYEGMKKDNIPIFILIYDQNEKIVAQLGLIIYKSLNIYSAKILDYVFNVFLNNKNKGMWVDGPVIFSEKENSIKILTTLLDALEKLSNDENIIMVGGYTPHYKLFDDDLIKIFKNRQYKTTEFFTFLTDLKPTITEIWNSLTKNAQRDVTRAKKRDFLIKELDQKSVKDYFALTKIWAKTKGIDKQASKKIEEEYWKYYQKGKEIVFLAYENNELVASHRLGIFNGIVYSHKITNSYSKAGSLGGPLLTWHALEWAKNNDMKIYDFSGGQAPPKEGLNIKQYEKQWKSLLEYKRKWGGKETEYYNVFKIFKSNSYKMLRGLNKIDWVFREYKHKKFKKPI